MSYEHFQDPHFKKSKKKCKINFSNVFYLTQYMQNATISTYTPIQKRIHEIVSPLYLYKAVFYTSAYFGWAYSVLRAQQPHVSDRHKYCPGRYSSESFFLIHAHSPPSAKNSQSNALLFCLLIPDNLTQKSAKNCDNECQQVSAASGSLDYDLHGNQEIAQNVFRRNSKKCLLHAPQALS